MVPIIEVVALVLRDLTLVELVMVVMESDSMWMNKYLLFSLKVHYEHFDEDAASSSMPSISFYAVQQC